MKLFLSHASADLHWAEWIGALLQGAGHEVFLRHWEVGAGESIPAWIERRIAEADKVLAVFTPAYLAAQGPRADAAPPGRGAGTQMRTEGAERLAAVWRDLSGRDGFLVPIEVEPVATWPTLSSGRHALSLVGLDEGAAESALIRFLEPPTRPTGKPAFPGKGKGKGKAGGGEEAVTATAKTTAQGKSLVERPTKFPVELPLRLTPTPLRSTKSATRSASPLVDRTDLVDTRPIIRSNSDLQIWLAGQPRAFARLIAIRAALRVAPLLVRVQARQSGTFAPSFVLLPLLRSVAALWAAARYPSRGADVRLRATTEAAASAAIVAGAIVPNAYLTDPGATTAAAIAYAAVVSSDTLGPAADTIAEAGYAVDAAAGAADRAVFWDAVTLDAQALHDRVDSTGGVTRPLWPNGMPKQIARAMLDLSNTLLGRDKHWHHWLEWLNDRLSDDPTRTAGDEEKDLARLTLPEEMWEAATKSVEGVKAVNAEIARRLKAIDDRRAAEARPPEPSEVAGPAFEFTSNAGLATAPADRAFEVDDAEVTATLHDSLRDLLPRLRDATHKVSNRHPDLAGIIGLYADLIAADTPAVAKLWAAGAELHGFAEAFAGQDTDRTLTDPLEPTHLAMLTSAARLHGAFVLGFPLGRKLTEDADRFRLAAETLAAIGRPMATILEGLGRQDGWVEEETRRFLSAIGATWHTTGWKLTTSAHAAYVAVRNALVVVTRHLVKANSALATVAGGLAMIKVDPGLEMTQLAIAFVGDNARTIMEFASPFPELRSWFGWVVDHLDRQTKP